MFSGNHMLNGRRKRGRKFTYLVVIAMSCFFVIEVLLSSLLVSKKTISNSFSPGGTLAKHNSYENLPFLVEDGLLTDALQEDIMIGDESNDLTVDSKKLENEAQGVHKNDEYDDQDASREESELTPSSIERRKEYGENETGSFMNCTEVYEDNEEEENRDNHPDEGFFMAYCQKVYYRIPQESFKTRGSIIFGVLSGAGGNGPVRRQSIRDTWAHNRDAVFFLVAGPWSDIKEEYETYKDMLWIDKEEVYDGENSVLTFKTVSFISVVHILSERLDTKFGYVFKTDDDSYLNIKLLYKVLYDESHEPFNYWGWCQRKKFPPLRGPTEKYAISYETYPEPKYPRYCQGAGFALSRKFIECMAGRESIANARYMPFEDVAIGIQAERCGVTPTMVEDPQQFWVYRANTDEEKEQVYHNKARLDEKYLPTPNMVGKVLQHRIQSDSDMKKHHEAMLDPNYWKKHASQEEIDYVEKWEKENMSN